MDCGRKMIYFSTYENGVKLRRAGYAAVFIRGESCDVQIYYRGDKEETGLLQPVYMFRDGSVALGEEIPVDEGMGATVFRTGQQDFVRSGRCFAELETIYLDGVKEGVCGGRPDGRDLSEEAYTTAEQLEYALPEEEIVEEVRLCDEEDEIPERWPLAECMEHFEEMKLPFDGIRRKCCRISPEDLEHFPEEWQFLKENHFLLHGYYEYHHLLLVRLSCRCGERYAVAVPGEFCYRNQYMAENFGFWDFAPLEPGRRRPGCFGYWYYYLEEKKKSSGRAV